jgi:hypothetical protein
LRPDVTASALFQDQGSGRFVGHDLRRHSNDTAAEAMRRLERALARCDLVTEHGPTGATRPSALTLVEPSAVPEPAVRFRLSRNHGAIEWRADVVIVRRGDVLSMVAVYGSVTDEPRLADLVDRVDERLAALT